jgi:hypothetical protein
MAETTVARNEAAQTPNPGICCCKTKAPCLKCYVERIAVMLKQHTVQFAGNVQHHRHPSPEEPR